MGKAEVIACSHGKFVDFIPILKVKVGPTKTCCDFLCDVCIVCCD